MNGPLHDHRSLPLPCGFAATVAKTLPLVIRYVTLTNDTDAQTGGSFLDASGG